MFTWRVLYLCDEQMRIKHFSYQYCVCRMCEESGVCTRTSAHPQSARQRSWTSEDRSTDQRGRFAQRQPADGSRSADAPPQELCRANGHRLRPQPSHLWHGITQHPSADTAGWVCVISVTHCGAWLAIISFPVCCVCHVFQLVVLKRHLSEHWIGRVHQWQ